MEKLIREMIGYIQTVSVEMDTSSSILLKSAENIVGIKMLRVISINILDWLKLEQKRTLWIKEGKKTKSKPLEINYNFPWCQGLKKLIEENEIFKNAFSLNGKEVYYNETVDEETREKARVLAYGSYNPPLMR